MAFPRNNFFDPATLDSYDWVINHTDAEGPSRPSTLDFEGKKEQRSRFIQGSESTIGFVGVEGDGEPLRLVLTGRVLHRSQYVEFWKWREKKNSFYFTDFDGQEYEVTMVGLEFTPLRASYNPADPSMRTHTFEYSMELVVLNIRAGDLFDAGVEA